MKRFITKIIAVCRLKAKRFAGRIICHLLCRHDMRYEFKVSFPLTDNTLEFYRCQRCGKYEQRRKVTK